MPVVQDSPVNRISLRVHFISERSFLSHQLQPSEELISTSPILPSGAHFLRSSSSTSSCYFTPIAPTSIRTQHTFTTTNQESLFHLNSPHHSKNRHLALNWKRTILWWCIFVIDIALSAVLAYTPWEFILIFGDLMDWIASRPSASPIFSPSLLWPCDGGQPYGQFRRIYKFHRISTWMGIYWACWYVLNPAYAYGRMLTTIQSPFTRCLASVTWADYWRWSQHVATHSSFKTPVCI